jgi:hypothetical protein
VKKLLSAIRNIFAALGAIGLTVLAVILGLEKGEKKDESKKMAEKSVNDFRGLPTADKLRILHNIKRK